MPPWWPPIRPWWWSTEWLASKCKPKRFGGLLIDFKLPRAIVINKLDRERADFERALSSVQETFGRAAVPIQIPIGKERDFTGVVDVIRMKSYTYSSDGDGKGKEGDIPAGLAEAAKQAHEALVEMVAEGNDALMEEFFDQGTLPVEHIVEGLNQAVRELRLFPVLCASALHNIGADQILNFMVENLPGPTERARCYRCGGWQGSHSAGFSHRTLFAVRFQNGRRSFCRKDHVLQSGYRRC